MALPLKSGADLYNQQALRLRLHNLGADPLEVGEGLIYYNTSTGLNTSGKARIYTGAGWKTLAFSEDLDVASNAEFIALKEKVDLLAGDVDTDAIISNMKEVAAFLDGFAEDADLMTYLTTELGKKLDKTGGTLTGNLTISKGGEGGLYIGDSSVLYNGANTRLFRNASTSDDYGTYLINAWTDGDTRFILTNGGVFFRDANKTSRVILHSGNVGSYALPIDGSAMMAGALHLERRTTGTVNVGSNDGLFLYRGPSTGSVDIGLPGDYYNLLNIGASGAYSNLQLSWYRSTIPRIFARAQDGSNYGSWRELAFTDSDITGYAAGLKHSNGTVGAIINSTGGVTIGSSDLAETNAKLYVDGGMVAKRDLGGNIGNYINYQHYAQFEIGRKSNTMCVTIAISDDDYGIIQTKGRGITSTGKLAINPNGGDIYLGGVSGLNSYVPRVTITNDGNVGIGTTDPKYKLDVAGSFAVGTETSSSIVLRRSNYHSYIIGASSLAFCTNNNSNNIALELWADKSANFLGNLTAAGEISCGGAGEEGVGGGGASVYQHVFTPSASPSVTILHNLGTEDIVITLYEKDATSGLWSVCLTDIEIVSANEVTITFGSTSSQEHKVVIMGGAA